MKGTKHINLLKSKCKITDIFKPCDTSRIKSCISNDSPSTSTGKNTIDSFATKNEVLDAEIYWVLKCIKSHQSFNSSEGSSRLFQKMFPDSAIAKQFACGKSKAAYMCHFGIGPYFQNKLFEVCKNLEHYTVLFDETLNKSNQRKQMDIHLRYWDSNMNKVCTQYLTSTFFGHATADDMLKSFYSATEKINLSKLLQISMDGPNVNWKFYDSLQSDLKREFDMKCVSIGSCGLHIINNAFRKGVEITGWNLSNLLNSLYWIFKDSPARREDFLSISAEKKFPIKFCHFRWLENCPAAERAIEIWEDVVLYVKKIESGTFSKVSCKSFSTVAEATKDKTILIKLNVFLSVANILKPFLELYQSDNPLIPFFAEDILKLVTQCLQLFHVLKDEDAKSITTPEKLCKFDFTKTSCYAPKHTVSLGFIGDKIMKEMVFKKSLSDKDCFHLKYECQQFVLKMIEWLMMKCPVNYLLVRNAACLDPRYMISNSKNAKMRMKTLLSCLSKSKQISDKDGDEILIKYDDFLREIVKKSEVEFKNFDLRTQSLDEFFSPYFKDERFLKLWNVFKIVLILSHGQAAVERGFSVNKAVEVENLKEDSYISQRLVYDNIKQYDEVCDLEITKELRLSASSARAKYMTYLENQRVLKYAQNDFNKKRKLVENEIGYLQKKKKCLQNDIAECEKDADIYSEKGEANRDISFFLKSNMLRKTIKEKSLTVAEIDTQIMEKQNDLKKL